VVSDRVAEGRRVHAHPKVEHLVAKHLGAASQVMLKTPPTSSTSCPLPAPPPPHPSSQVAAVLGSCSRAQLPEAAGGMKELCDLGYSAMDIITTLFRVRGGGGLVSGLFRVRREGRAGRGKGGREGAHPPAVLGEGGAHHRAVQGEGGGAAFVSGLSTITAGTLGGWVGGREGGREGDVAVLGQAGRGLH
jgi:hypothetical protein